MSFGSSVRSSVSKVKEQVNTKAIKIATELFTTTVKLTPVSSPSEKKRGELINNWYIGTGGVHNKSYSSSFSITGSASIQRISTLRLSREFAGKDGAVSMTNIVSYGYRAEYAGWPAPKWNNSKPYAMMRNALTLVSSKYK